MRAASFPVALLPLGYTALFHFVPFVCAVSGSPAMSQAAAYYVSPAGDDANPGTEQQPFKTIQKGADTARAGDTVIVRDGIYDTWGEQWPDGEKYGVFVRHGGTSESTRVTIKAENRHRAVLSGIQAADSNIGFGHNTNVSYVTIQDFVIHDFGHALHINNNNKHIIFKGNDISHVWGGVSVGNDCDYVTVDSNIIHDYGLSNDVYGRQGGTDQYHGIYLRGRDAVVQNNVLYNYKGAGWHIQAGSYSVPPTGIYRIVNNTLIGHGTADHGQVCFYSTDLDGVAIENNIFSEPGSYLIRPSGDAGVAMSIQNNLISSPLVDFFSLPYKPRVLAVSGNVVGKSPRFADPEKNDFHLQSGSPALDAGTGANAPTADCDGTKRPQGAGWDIGAYEDGSSKSDANR